LELQWNLCPFCGNQYVDPYGVETPGTDEAEAPEWEVVTGDDDEAEAEAVAVIDEESAEE
jgi:hypothetical protein